MTLLILAAMLNLLPHIPLVALDFPTIGGGAGIAASSLWALREFLTWLDRRRVAELTEDTQHVAATSSAVSDAATTNAVMLATNAALHTEIGRLGTIVDDLRTIIVEKDRIIVETQDEVRRLMTKMATLYETLESLKSK